MLVLDYDDALSDAHVGWCWHNSVECPSAARALKQFVRDRYPPQLPSVTKGDHESTCAINQSIGFGRFVLNELDRVIRAPVAVEVPFNGFFQLPSRRREALRLIGG